MEFFWKGISLNLPRSIPEIIAWIFGIVLAVIMLRRGGSRAEKLLLAGCSLMLFTVLANPFVQGLIQYLISKKDTTNLYSAQTLGWISMPMTILSLGGIVCLILAFWLKFWRKRKETA